MERQIPAIQIAQQTVNAPEVQSLKEVICVQAVVILDIDKVVDLPVVIQRLVPMIQEVQEREHVPQVWFVNAVVDVPVVTRRSKRFRQFRRQ